MDIRISPKSEEAPVISSPILLRQYEEQTDLKNQKMHSDPENI